MHGYVTTRHLLTHGPVIVREFGWRVFLRCCVRCLVSGRPATFLGVVRECKKSGR